MSKEYTYEIDKYTIGVDENGEDGIGLTIAIIKNGGIYLLGNCYGENARCIDLLIKENKELKQKYINAVADYEMVMSELQELKKQLEENKLNHKQLKDLDKIEKSFIEIKNQQKEFIKYINAYIELLKDKPDLVEEGQKDILEEILSKYKEIIGDDNE